MRLLDKSINKAVCRPVKVLQFGEGNFLRGFADAMIDEANEKGLFNGSIVIVKPRPHGNLKIYKEQDCLYTLSLRGIENGEARVVNRIITSISDAVSAYEDYGQYASYAKLDTLRFIISNTTEAGIVFEASDSFTAEPPVTFPGKLTKLLYERFEYYKGDNDKGLIVIPCELIENNGDTLKKCVLSYAELWNLEEGFAAWVKDSCIFCNTLVDRIITGYPKEEAEDFFKAAGYEDRLFNTGELFGLWVVESSKDISSEFPLDKAGLPVIFTDDQKPYRERKVRILNGAHTSFALASYLAGNNMVLESMKDELIRNYVVHTIYDEIIPTLTLPASELKDFAASVLERFENPYIKHALLSISLNSVAKWKSRCLPAFKDYVNKFGRLPSHLTFSAAALMSFYRSGRLTDNTLIGSRNEEEYIIMDDRKVLEFFAEASKLANREFAEAFLGKTEFFGEDMTRYEGLTEAVAKYLDEIDELGIRKVIERISE